MLIFPVNDSFVEQVSKLTYEQKSENGTYHLYQPEINLIDFFIEQDFVPFFNDANWDKIYNSMLRRQALLAKQEKLEVKLRELETKLAELGPSPRGLQKGIDIKARLKPYDLAEADASPAIYHQFLIQWLDELLADLERFDEDEAEILAAAEALNKTVAGFMSKEEVLLERKSFLAGYLDSALSGLYRDLIAFKAEAVSGREELRSAKDMARLREVEVKPRPRFRTIAEQTAGLTAEKLSKIAWFKENREAVDAMAKLHAAWANNFEDFLVGTKKYFMEKCSAQNIDFDVSAAWWEGFQVRRILIEQSLIPPLKHRLFEAKLWTR